MAPGDGRVSDHQIVSVLLTSVIKGAGKWCQASDIFLCKGLREWLVGALRGFHGEQASAGSAGRPWTRHCTSMSSGAHWQHRDGARPLRAGGMDRGHVWVHFTPCLGGRAQQAFAMWSGPPGHCPPGWAAQQSKAPAHKQRRQRASILFRMFSLMTCGCKMHRWEMLRGGQLGSQEPARTRSEVSTQLGLVKAPCGTGPLGPAETLVQSTGTCMGASRGQARCECRPDREVGDRHDANEGQTERRAQQRPRLSLSLSVCLGEAGLAAGHLQGLGAFHAPPLHDPQRPCTKVLYVTGACLASSADSVTWGHASCKSHGPPSRL